MRPESEVRQIVRDMEEERNRVLSTEVTEEDQIPKMAAQLNMLNTGLAVGYAILETKDPAAVRFDRFRKELPESVQRLIEDEE